VSEGRRQQKKLFREATDGGYQGSPEWKRRRIKRLPLPTVKGVSPTAMMVVLEKLLELCESRRSCTATRERIAVESRIHVRQVGRVLKALSGAGLITIEHQSRKRTGHRAASRYSIPGITCPAGPDKPRSSGSAASAAMPGADPKGKNVPLAKGHVAPRPEGHNVPRPEGHNVPALRSFLSCSNSKDPPPPTLSLRDGQEWWMEVERELFESIGIQDPKPALAVAIERGCTPEFIRSLIEVYRSKPGAWDAGGLRRRIFNAFPGQDPTAHWLRERPAWLDRQRAERARQEAGESERRRDAAKAEAEKLREELSHFTAEDLLAFVDSSLGDVVRPLARKQLRESGPAGLSPMLARPILDAARAAALDPVPPAGEQL
jgi:hypothetical protein